MFVGKPLELRGLTILRLYIDGVGLVHYTLRFALKRRVLQSAAVSNAANDGPLWHKVVAHCGALWSYLE